MVGVPGASVSIWSAAKQQGEILATKYDTGYKIWSCISVENWNTGPGIEPDLRNCTGVKTAFVSYRKSHQCPKCLGHLSTCKQEGVSLNTTSFHIENGLFAKSCHLQSSLLPIYLTQGGLGPFEDLQPTQQPELWTGCSGLPGGTGISVSSSELPPARC